MKTSQAIAAGSVLFAAVILAGMGCCGSSEDTYVYPTNPTREIDGMSVPQAIAKVAKPQSIFDFVVLGPKKAPIDMATYKGQTLLIMNVASQCGFTENGYSAATELYNKYKDKGFNVLAFPCNQFKQQEPGTEEEIQNFVCTRFNAEYPIMSKVDVNGDNADPLWTYLKKAKPGLLGTEFIKWNFTVFLCSPEGKVMHRYAPGAKAADIEKDLLKLLPTSATPSS